MRYRQQIRVRRTQTMRRHVFQQGVQVSRFIGVYIFASVAICAKSLIVGVLQVTWCLRGCLKII